MTSVPTEGEMYVGRVRYRFYPDSHKYWLSVDGGPFKQRTSNTGVLKILNTPLDSWYQQITAEFLLNLVNNNIPLDHEIALECAIQNEVQKEEAANAGKQAHEWAELFIKKELGELKSLPPMPQMKEAISGVNAFNEWWDSNNVAPVFSEKVVYSLQNDVIGTLDLDARVNGKRAVVDFKTSNSLYNKVRLQTVGYKIAVEEEAGKKLFKERWAIRLSKHTESEHYRKEERKRELKRMIAKKKGWQFREYDIRPYQVFEAKCLDDDAENMDIDEKAYLSALHLHRWNGATDFQRN